MVGSRVLRNCWCRTGFDWFPGLVYEEDDVGDDDGNKGNDKDDSDAYNDSLFDSDDEGEESNDGKD